MHSYRRRAAVVVIGSLLAASGAQGDQKLSVRVTPAVMYAPATITVTATIARDPGNRALQVDADSGGFYRSSFVQLEGDRAPRVSQVQLKHLPSGDYLVGVVLVDNAGRRTVVQKPITVLPSASER
ncbi:MAG: hypothetical protein ACLGHP_04325 [Vicinamibacteria bacterium]